MGNENSSADQIANTAYMTKDHIDSLVDQAEDAMQLLGRTLLQGVNPPAGPYPFFHFNGLCIGRLRNCQTILHRLFAGRQKFSELAIERRAAEPAQLPPEAPCPEEVQRIFREEHRVGLEMRLDMESLYVFGRMMLDQWALEVAIVCGVPIKRQHPFSELVVWFETTTEHGAAEPLWRDLRHPLLLLFHQLQFYRNKVVVHADRPWQRGQSHNTVGEDFCLDFLSPPGWLDDASLHEAVHSLIPLAPADVQPQLELDFQRNPRLPLQILFENIHLISSAEDRRRIAQVFNKLGGSTPSFQVVGFRLTSLVAEGTALLIPIANANLEAIDLGKPFHARLPTRK